VKWWRLAADQDLAGAQKDLGTAYHRGWGVPPDLNEARKWWTLAAKNGSPVAANNLAHLNGLAKGRQEPAQDLMTEAKRLWQAGNKAASVKPLMAAAQAGNAEAQMNFGSYYEKGLAGVAQSFPEAARWYAKAAEAGNATAMKNLGQLYENGTGVPEDWAAAATWYQKSADLGDVHGQNALARAFQFGIGVPQSRQQAIQWDRRAASQGDGRAAYYARSLSAGGPIGFRNAAERNLFPGLPTAPVRIEPVGVTFRNSSERMAFVRQVAQQYAASMSTGPRPGGPKGDGTYTDRNGHEWPSRGEFDRICNPLRTGRPSQCPG
jgi:TPR repeat protein